MLTISIQLDEEDGDVTLTSITVMSCERTPMEVKRANELLELLGYDQVIPAAHDDYSGAKPEDPTLN